MHDIAGPQPDHKPNNSKHSEQGTRNDMQVRRIRQRSKTVKIGKLFVIAKPWINDFIFEDAQ